MMYTCDLCGRRVSLPESLSADVVPYKGGYRHRACAVGAWEKKADMQRRLAVVKDRPEEALPEIPSEELQFCDWCGDALIESRDEIVAVTLKRKYTRHQHCNDTISAPRWLPWVLLVPALLALLYVVGSAVLNPSAFVLGDTSTLIKFGGIGLALSLFSLSREIGAYGWGALTIQNIFKAVAGFAVVGLFLLTIVHLMAPILNLQ